MPSPRLHLVPGACNSGWVTTKQIQLWETGNKGSLRARQRSPGPLAFCPLPPAPRPSLWDKGWNATASLR